MDTGRIPSYSIFIHPRDWQQLTRDIWCDDPQPAKLRIGSEWTPIDIAYRGAHTRDLRKKSYQVWFMHPRRGKQSLHLNAEYLDPSLIRNKLSLDFFREIGVPSPHAQHVLLTVNGRFCGVYLQLESIDEVFFADRGMRVESIYYAVNDNANFSLISGVDGEVKKCLESGYEKKFGSDSEDSLLRELIYKVNTVSREDFENEIAQYINLDHYLLWLAGVVCTQNFDGFIQNYTLYRDSATGRFGLIPWDFDATWGRDIHGETMAYDYVPIEGYNTLTARILDVPNYRRRYAQIMERILEIYFTVEFLEPKVKALHQLLRPQVQRDPYIQHRLAQFDSEPAFILEFVTMRNRYLKEQMSKLSG